MAKQLLAIVALLVMVFSNAAFASGGYTWSAVSGPADCYDLSASSTGQYIECIGANDTIYTSANYGSSWTAETSAGNRPWAYFGGDVSSTGQYMVAAALNGDYVYLSNDYGSTWSSLTGIGIGSYDSAAVSSNGQDLYAVNDTGDIYASTNGGSSWTTYAVSGANSLADLSISSNGQYIYAVNIGNGNIYVSHNYGSSWSTAGSVGQYGYARVFTTDSGQYAVAEKGDDNHVYITNNYGASWTMETPTASASFGYAVISSNGQDIMTGSENSNGMVYESFDGGQTWLSDASLGVGDGSGWWTLTASADLSYALSENADSNFYTGNDPALFVSNNQGNQNNGGQTTPISTTSTTPPGADPPDTGFGMPAPNAVATSLFTLSSVCVVLGLISLYLHRKTS